MHQSSYDRCLDFVHKYLDPLPGPLQIADIGSCNVNGTYRDLFSRSDWQYTGFDLEVGPNVDVVMKSAENWDLSGKHLAAYDIVVSGQVLEHVRRPWRWIHQLTAVCRPSGLIWICAPNTWHYHEWPIDCWRVWPEGMRALFEDAGLDVLECAALGPDTIGVARKTGRSDGSSPNVTP